jgi:hypothetical protein
MTSRPHPLPHPDADPELRARVPRLTAAAALCAAVAACLATACSGTAPLNPARTAAATSTPSGAAAPSPRPAAPTACGELQVALADAGRAVDTARERKADAWKLVVPFAVLARHAQAGNELEAAEKQLATLQAQSAREGCGGGR